MLFCAAGVINLPLVVALLASRAAGSTTVKVTVPASVPHGAANVSRSLISLSIEQDRWRDWIGFPSRNDFFFNTLDNVAQLAGQPPWIRLGANSEDHTVFNEATQFSEAIFPPPSLVEPYPEATQITVGNDFYKAVAQLPSGTNMIVGVNLGANNPANAVTEASAIEAAFASLPASGADVELQYIEVGNEADLYTTNGLRPKSFNVAQYTQQWASVAGAVANALRLSPTGSGPKFVAGALAQSSHKDTTFSPQAIFSHGLLKSAPGKIVQTVSQHHYSGSFCAGSGGLLSALMNKATIRSNLTVFKPDIAAVHAKGLIYILGETNSYACHGAPGVSNVAGATLWLLDYALHASQIGIERLFFHNGIGFKYNLIQPIALNRSILDGSALAQPLAPHVQPAYYGMIIAAEALGSSGRVQVAELDISNADVAGYAFYEGGIIMRAVLINSRAFLSTTSSRNTVHVDLNLSSASLNGTMTIKRLSIGHADDESGLAWGGQTYETPDGRVSGDEIMERSTIRAGVDVQDTEIVLLNFDRSAMVAGGSDSGALGKGVSSPAMTSGAAMPSGAAGSSGQGGSSSSGMTGSLGSSRSSAHRAAYNGLLLTALIGMSVALILG
ncbi:hypothetical protein PUNSTDRAFT_108442 [Punctularia strigosozonata HHB-11173 SS5]|uniref:Beta-glucuronidase C-terminal domain-containing protein n=1 Tax=Punctularia strigosozonata (strain HHB-11173) TaxID=741275 RepID=R7S1Q3_PUNST|nr:uncharacterized protein PUNSTDRAFT_108442 [Punctularia strigosozonata HHB-11173 SS5]EIN04315.1 hypothetical protein PUNSTDRAFT_108442 [Punctularia strigosozonata HHB-11173 SS5]